MWVGLKRKPGLTPKKHSLTSSLAPFPSLLKAAWLPARSSLMPPHPADNAHPPGASKCGHTAPSSPARERWKANSSDEISPIALHICTSWGHNKCIISSQRDLFSHRLTTCGREQTISPKDLYESPNMTVCVCVCVCV